MFQDLATLSPRELLHLNRKPRAESLTLTFLTSVEDPFYFIFSVQN